MAHRFVTWSVWVREPEAVGNIESTVRKLRKMNVGAPHAFPFILNSM